MVECWDRSYYCDSSTRAQPSSEAPGAQTVLMWVTVRFVKFAAFMCRAALEGPAGLVLLTQPECSCPNISAPASAWTLPLDQLWEKELSGLQERPCSHLLFSCWREFLVRAAQHILSAAADRRRRNRAPRLGMGPAQSQLRLAS